jgi:hypothetical protein
LAGIQSFRLRGVDLKGGLLLGIVPDPARGVLLLDGSGALRTLDGDDSGLRYADELGVHAAPGQKNEIKGDGYMSSNGKAAAFNLCDDPWIPCVTTKGEALDLSLKGFFEKAEALSDFSATPPQRVALMRLLIAITMRALEGPKDDADWKSCRPRIKQAALAYLERMRDRFELYGPKAFLQVPSWAARLTRIWTSSTSAWPPATTTRFSIMERRPKAGSLRPRVKRCLS